MDEDTVCGEGEARKGYENYFRLLEKVGVITFGPDRR